MREPWFWRSDSLSAKAIVVALKPVSAAYQAGQRLRWIAASPVSVEIPVICIGNASLGGTGKTPFALLVESLLRAEGVNVFFLTRGHGGAKRGPLLVDPKTHSPADVGDEALLLAKQAPTIIARNRPAGAKLAAQSGAQAIVMDDGFQNPSLKKDLSILLLRAGEKEENQKTFPAGPYRETAMSAAARADITVRVGDNEQSGDNTALGDFHAWLTPSSAPALGKVLAFAGIGKPERFFSMLTRFGYDVTGRAAFPDHHAFSDAELNVLARKAAQAKAHLICTEKDFVRLPAAFCGEVLTFPVEMRVNDLEGLKRRLVERVAAGAKQRDNVGDD